MISETETEIKWVCYKIPRVTSSDTSLCDQRHNGENPKHYYGDYYYIWLDSYALYLIVSRFWWI